MKKNFILKQYFITVFMIMLLCFFLLGIEKTKKNSIQTQTNQSSTVIFYDDVIQYFKNVQEKGRDAISALIH